MITELIRTLQEHVDIVKPFVLYFVTMAPQKEY